VGSFLAVSFIFMLCLGLVSLVVRDLSRTIEQIHEMEHKEQLTNHLQLYLDRLLKPANNYLITGEIRERDNLDQLIGEISKIMKELQTYRGDPEWQTLANRVNQDVLKLSEMLIAVMFVDRPIGRTEAAQLMREANLFSESVVEKVGRFQELTEQEMSKISGTAVSKAARVQFVFYTTLAAAILFTVFLFLYLSRFIIHPILNLYQGAQIVASGDLDYRLSIKTSDEIGDLAKEFNRMIQAISVMKKELDHKIEETRQLAITDALTNLYNHRFCIEKLNDEIKRAERYDRPLSIILADIDFFKNYNDANGHLRGDDLLRIFGSVLKSQMRNADFVCRTGGEEFVVILPETEEAVAIQIAERLRTSIENHPFPYKETQPGRNLTVSLGVASYIKGQMALEKFIKAADDALYQAKRGGRNKVAALTRDRSTAESKSATSPI